jgi:hypothetical protein
VNYDGTLALTVTAGTLTGGESFDLFDFTGASGGTFATITTTPALAADLNWWQGSLAANGVIVVNRAPVAAPIAMGGLSGASTTVQIIGGKYAPTDADGNTLVVSAVQNPASGGGIVSTAPAGSLQVATTGNQGSGVLSSMVQANGLIVLHHTQGNVAKGGVVDVMMFDGMI